MSDVCCHIYMNEDVVRRIRKLNLQNWKLNELKQLFNQHHVQYCLQITKSVCYRFIVELARDRKWIRTDLNRFSITFSINAFTFITIAPMFSPKSSSRHQCRFCNKRQSENRFPTKKIIHNCDHNQNICLKCLKRNISLQFKKKNWNRLSCLDCEQMLKFQNVKNFAKTKIFKKYNVLLLYIQKRIENLQNDFKTISNVVKSWCF